MSPKKTKDKKSKSALKKPVVEEAEPQTVPVVEDKKKKKARKEKGAKKDSNEAAAVPAKDKTVAFAAPLADAEDKGSSSNAVKKQLAAARLVRFYVAMSCLI